MLSVKFLAAALLVTAVSAGTPRDGASCRDYMFIADEEDLCRYHWCQGDGSIVEMRCAPGSRVATWYVGSPDDHEIPCIIDHRPDVSCLRCDIAEDPELVVDRDDCDPNPCPSQCRCEDNWQQAVCLCPGDDVFIATGAAVARPDFCDPDRCRNGAVCYSQWDDYWCQCPNGYTGKNCEIPFCDPNPCNNGGTCTIDSINYHCECTECFRGSCCDEQIGNGVECEETEITTTRPRPPTSTPERNEDCDPCEYGPTCELRKTWLCDCNCPNYNDVCVDNEEFGEAVECTKDTSVTAGTPFTILFMENSNEAPEKRKLEIYVSNAGTTPVEVTVRTPLLDEDQECYYRETKVIESLSVASYDATPCLELIGSSIEDKGIIAEEKDGKDIVVYAANKERWSADAFLAIPDNQGGYYFVVTAYEARYASQFAVVSLKDGNKVSFTLPSGVTSDFEPGTYTLDQFQTLQVQADQQDITGAYITCTERCHVWSGNVRALVTEGAVPIRSGSRDHIVEQLLPVQKWGFTHFVQPIPDRIFGDLLKIVALEPTDVTIVERNIETGAEKTTTFKVGESSSYLIFEVYSNFRYIVSSDKNPISVMQIVKSRDLRTEEEFHDPALITIPAAGSHANNFILSTPYFSGGVGEPKPYQMTLLLVICEEDQRDNIMVASNGKEPVSLNSLGAEWVKMPENTRGVYYSCYIEIEVGTSRIFIADRTARFQAIFYAFDDRETLGFPLSVRVENDNDVKPPIVASTTTSRPVTTCDSCHFGDNCEETVNTCSCSPCARGQLCDSYNDEKICVGTDGPFGSQYTLTFLRQSSGGYKRVHIAKTGADIGRTFVVRIYTSDLDSSDDCYVDETIELDGASTLSTTYVVQSDCLETEEYGSGKVLRIVEENERDIIVTVSNSDGDGYLALPDDYAGEYYMVHALKSSGSIQYVQIVAHEDDTVIRYRQRPVERLAGFTSAFEDGSEDVSAAPEITLDALESIYIALRSEGSDPELRGTVITSNKPINVWSGNLGPQKTAEMLLTVNRWGSTRIPHYYTIVQAGQRDQVVVYSAVDCTYRLVDIATDGTRTTAARGSIAAGSSVILPRMGRNSDAVWELRTSAPVQVTHTVSATFDSESVGSAYALIPSLDLFASSFTWRTHGSIDGLGSNYESQVVTIVTIDTDRYSRESLLFYYYDYASGRVSYYTPTDLGASWRLVGTGDGAEIYATKVTLPGYGFYHLWNTQSSSYRFSAVYYGGVSEAPNTAYPLGFDASELNDIRKPVLCSSCYTGPNCDQVRVRLCACNPCGNFDDICTNGANSTAERTCTSVPDSTGNPFTLMFMQNRPDDTDKRALEIYVTSAGVTGRTVKIYTPFLNSNDACYFMVDREIPAFVVEKFSVEQQDCFETKESGTFDDNVIRVESESGKDLLVYAVNREEWSADGFVCLPDRHAGLDYYAVTYAPAFYHTQLAFLALEDDTEVTLTYRSGASPELDTTVFYLKAGESVQIQSKRDLTGTRIRSTKPINAYSGNVRALVTEHLDSETPRLNSGSRDHIVEQLLPVRTWGMNFHIVPIPGRIFGDQLKFVAAYENTEVVIYENRNGVEKEVYRSTLGASDFDVFDVFSDIAYRLESSDKLFVVQITKSKDRTRETANDPSLITIPPVGQYTNRYIFSTPLFSGGVGQPRPYNTSVILISATEADMDDIVVFQPSVSEQVRVSDLGRWVKVPGVDYYNIAVEINSGTNIIYHPDSSREFMCVYYGFDDRESLGMPAGLKLQAIDRTIN